MGGDQLPLRKYLLKCPQQAGQIVSEQNNSEKRKSMKPFIWTTIQGSVHHSLPEWMFSAWPTIKGRRTKAKLEIALNRSHQNCISFIPKPL